MLRIESGAGMIRGQHHNRDEQNSKGSDMSCLDRNLDSARPAHPGKGSLLGRHLNSVLPNTFVISDA